ncbi:MAG: hypothetical protein LIO54_00025 [Oscillospiraceae bacterium]|nr:hypothetical protein [Oscillospiraceae bacterium]
MDFNEIKNKVLATIGQASDGAKDLADKAAEKAKVSGRIAKLGMELASARETVKKNYQELGKLYFDQHADDPEPEFVQLIEELRITMQNIADMEAETAELKASLKSSGGEDAGADIVDFEAVVQQTEAEAAEEPEIPVEPEAAAGPEVPAEAETPAEPAPEEPKAEE